jgi:hypothetical protein
MTPFVQASAALVKCLLDDPFYCAITEGFGNDLAARKQTAWNAHGDENKLPRSSAKSFGNRPIRVVVDANVHFCCEKDMGY